MKKNRTTNRFTFDVRKPQFKWFVLGVVFSLIGVVMSAIWLIKLLIYIII